MADSISNITDDELQQRLARFGHTVTTGKLTEAQRQIQKKKLNHLEAKERAEKEKAEKAEKEAAKRARGSPPPKKRARTARRRTVAIPTGLTAEESEDQEIGEPAVDYNAQKTPLKSPIACKDKFIVDPNVPESSPLVVRVNDVGVGHAAASVPVTLSVLHKTKGWFLLAERHTNMDGECPGLITKDLFQGGLYRIHLDTAEYYKLSTSTVHFPQVETFVHVEEPGERYTVSVLLMPYGYTSTVVKSN